jgi:hypothetical protein
MRDRAAVNNRTIDMGRETLWLNAFDITCVSHALNNVGKKFKVDLTTKLLQLICRLTDRKRSPKSGSWMRTRLVCQFAEACKTLLSGFPPECFQSKKALCQTNQY